MRSLIDELRTEHILKQEEFSVLIENYNDVDLSEYVFSMASGLRDDIFGEKIYVRGLIEFSNYCRNNCYYCGIRAGNLQADRYRLTQQEILECALEGYELGYRSFVLQSGEDPCFSDDDICWIVSSIRENLPDCAVTLSIGEKSRSAYQSYFDAGADRYLLRHETARSEHYRKLHPEELTLDNRIRCLYDLKEIGYQVGCGFMVGSPYQTADCLAEDLLFIHAFEPHMVGIGPFIPSAGTPFADRAAGSVELTLFMIALIRLMLPHANIPATTALGTLDPMGREKGIRAGANVLMPNLSPVSVRKKYSLYDNKICTGDESAQCRSCLERRVMAIGHTLAVDRGDAPGWSRKL